jgi:basic amino acid/polyamine antiporter, APA family
LDTNHPQNFERDIGLRKAILHMVGNMIGVGIFIYPVLIASHLPHPVWFLIIWLIGGLIALAGALSSAELGTFFPEAGGDYAYLRNAYGKRWAFLYGFLTFFITFPGSIAIGVGLTVHYQGASLLGAWVDNVAISLPFLEIRYYQIIASIIVIILTFINHLGTSSSFLLQKLVTLGPIVFLIFISIIAILFIQWDLFWNGLTNSMLSKNLAIPFEMPKLLGLAAALVPVYWTFSGWNSPLSLGAEIQNPEKIIPRTMILGPLIVTVIYLLFSFVFIAVVPYFDFKDGKVDPYIVIGQYMLSNLGIYDKNTLELLPKVMSLIIFLIVIGNTNSCIVSGSRIYVAMARDKLFWEKVGYIDPVKKSPTVSLWLQSLWAILLILFISEESNLLNFSFIAITLLSVMTIFSIFLIRLKKIQIAKLYKAYGYPFTPILYILSSLFILVLIVIGYINERKFSILISAAVSITIGLVGYEIWKKYKLTHRED